MSNYHQRTTFAENKEELLALNEDQTAVHVGIVYPMRLQKFLARAGAASRRGSEDLMTARRVTVNGQVVCELGSKVDPATDTVAVDGIEISIQDKPVYLVLNKPVGYVSTMSDPHARHVVAKLVPTDKYPGLFSVGRLDADSCGLLLFTTDGELSHRILHPKWKVYKRYVAQVEGKVGPNELEILREGIELEDGMTAPAQVERMGFARGGEVLSIAIREGRNRQVRRMCETVGNPVRTLERISFGPVNLGNLEAGKWRLLDSIEIASLRYSVDMEGS